MIADEEMVCECLKISAKEIRDSIARGNNSVEMITEDTEAGSACGKCKSYKSDPKMSRKYHIEEDFLERS